MLWLDAIKAFITLIDVVVRRERERASTSCIMDDPDDPFFDYSYNPFRYMAPASRRALKREKTAKSLFHDAKVQFEQQHQHDELAAAAGKEKHVLEDVVPPKYHLTSHTWGTFRRWVENNHAGWKAKRRGKIFSLFATKSRIFQQMTTVVALTN